MSTPTPPEPAPPLANPAAVVRRLLRDDFTFFMSQIRDVNGQTLEVAPHLSEWCRLITTYPRLALLAPRGHGKSTVVLVYILWQFYRHATDPGTGRHLTRSAGTFQAVLFSATRDQAGVHMARFRDLLTENDWLFPDRAPGTPGSGRPVRASETHVRLACGASLLTRAFQTSTRGMHPDLLVLDDVLSDQNTRSEYARGEAWRYFVGTLLPMHPGRCLIVGTAQHAADLLHQLKPDRLARTGVGDETLGKFGFAWRRFQALNEDRQSTLWPSRYPYHELAAFRNQEPTVFSREYQNDPRDDASSFFPYALTQQAIDAGAHLTMVSSYRPTETELVILGADVALSEGIGADYTVAVVVAYDHATKKRRILTARRHRGLDFNAQITLFTELAQSYNIHLGIIEQNGFQRWLVQKLQELPGGARFFGHTTGGERATLHEGIPMLKWSLNAQEWIMPSGDAPSREFARIWQAELAAFGWRNGRLEGIGEHDDTVIACWFVERAIWWLYKFARPPEEEDEYVYMEDLGIEPVRFDG